jgi:hypothetical protein
VKQEPITIDVGGTDYEIGHIERWANDPDTFDGWLSETKGITDELVVNGADRWWATYRVLARYMETLIAEINATQGKKGGAARLNIEKASERLKGTAEEMEAILAAYLVDD